MDAFATHFESEIHKREYNKCKELYDCYINSASQPVNYVNNDYDSKNTSTNAGPKPEIAGEELSKKERTVKTFEKENNEATGVENLNENINLDQNKVIEDAPCVDNETSKGTAGTNSNCDSEKLYQPQEAMQIATVFAKENGIKFKYGSHSAYCDICNMRISSTLKRMQEHVATRVHEEKLSEKRPSPIAKTTVLEYVKDMITARDRRLSNVILNREICIDNLSFHMIVINEYDTYCQLCERTVNFLFIDFHLNTKTHINKLVDCVKVIIDTKFNGEFVREVRFCIIHICLVNWLNLPIENFHKVSSKPTQTGECVQNDDTLGDFHPREALLEIDLIANIRLYDVFQHYELLLIMNIHWEMALKYGLGD